MKILSLILLLAGGALGFEINGSGGGISQTDADTRYLNVPGDSATGQINLTSAAVSAHLSVATVTVTSTLTVQGNAFSVGTSTFVVTGSSVGIRTANPRSALDVDGLVQFGFSATKSTVSENGSIDLATNADVTVRGSTGYFFSQSTITIAGKLSSANIAPLHVGCDEAPLNFANQALAYFCGDDPSSSGLAFRNANGNSELFLRADTADVAIGAASNNNMLIKVDASGTPPAHLVITTSGRFIFTKLTDPAVVGITSGTFEIGGSEDYSFKVGASTLIARGSGNVGIGTAEPGTKLHVSSGVLTVDGSGAGLALSSGTTITNIFKSSFTFDFPNVPAAGTISFGYSTTGIANGGAVAASDVCWIEAPALEDYLSVSFASATTSGAVLSIKFNNPSVSGVDPGLQLYRYGCMRNTN